MDIINSLALFIAILYLALMERHISKAVNVQDMHTNYVIAYLIWIAMVFIFAFFIRPHYENFFRDVFSINGYLGFFLFIVLLIVSYYGFKDVVMS